MLIIIAHTMFEQALYDRIDIDLRWILIAQVERDVKYTDGLIL